MIVPAGGGGRKGVHLTTHAIRLTERWMYQTDISHSHGQRENKINKYLTQKVAVLCTFLVKYYISELLFPELLQISLKIQRRLTASKTETNSFSDKKEKGQKYIPPRRVGGKILCLSFLRDRWWSDTKCPFVASETCANSFAIYLLELPCRITWDRGINQDCNDLSLLIFLTDATAHPF